jgi:hypothetical protein
MFPSYFPALCEQAASHAHATHTHRDLPAHGKPWSAFCAVESPFTPAACSYYYILALNLSCNNGSASRPKLFDLQRGESYQWRSKNSCPERGKRSGPGIFRLLPLPTITPTIPAKLRFSPYRRLFSHFPLRSCGYIHWPRTGQIIIIIMKA